MKMGYKQLSFVLIQTILAMEFACRMGNQIFPAPRRIPSDTLSPNLQISLPYFFNAFWQPEPIDNLVEFKDTFDSFLNVILNYNTAMSSPILAEFKKQGKELTVRGNIQKEISFVHEQITGKTIEKSAVTKVLRTLQEYLMNKADAFEEKKDYDHALICYFHARRCALYDEKIADSTQLIACSNQAMSIRNRMIDVIKQQAVSLSSEAIRDFKRLWNDPQTRVESFYAWIKEHTSIHLLNFIVDTGDAFWGGKSRFDAFEETCTALSMLHSTENDFDHIYWYYNRRSNESLNKQKFRDFYDRYKKLDQNGRDAGIYNLLFMSNLLSGLPRILLGDDEADAEVILRPFLEQLLIEEEDINIIVLFCKEFRDFRMFAACDGKGAALIEQEFQATWIPQEREDLPELTFDTNALAKLKGCLQQENPEQGLTRLYDKDEGTNKGKGDLTAAISYLKLLDRIKSGEMTVIDHSIQELSFINLFRKGIEDTTAHPNAYNAFITQRRANDCPHIGENIFCAFPKALAMIIDYLERRGISKQDAIYFFNAVNFFHDIGDIIDKGDHALRGERLIEEILKAVNITDHILVTWAKFIIKNHLEFGGIYNAERSPKTVLDALAELDDAEEQQMLLKMLVVLNTADILTVNSGKIFNPALGEFMVSMLDINNLKTLYADYYNYRKNCFQRDKAGEEKRDIKEVFEQEWPALEQRLGKDFNDFKNFLRDAQMDHFMDVFIALNAVDIIKLLELFFTVYKASDKLIDRFDFTAPRRQAGLTGYIKELLEPYPQGLIQLALSKGEIQSKDTAPEQQAAYATAISLKTILDFLSEKGFTVHKAGEKMLIIDNRFVINVNRTLKLHAISNVVYYASRGLEGTLSDQQLTNNIFLLNLSKAADLKQMDSYWPIARLMGLLNAAIKGKKELDLEKTMELFKGKERYDITNLLFLIIGSELDQETRTVSEIIVAPENIQSERTNKQIRELQEYRNALETLKKVSEQQYLEMLIGWLKTSKTIRLRYTANQVDFGGAGFVQFLLALAMLEQLLIDENRIHSGREIKINFNNHYKEKLTRDKVVIAAQSIEHIISAYLRAKKMESGYGANQFAEDVLGIRWEEGFSLQEDKNVAQLIIEMQNQDSDIINKIRRENGIDVISRAI